MSRRLRPATELLRRHRGADCYRCRIDNGCGQAGGSHRDATEVRRVLARLVIRSARSVAKAHPAEPARFRDPASPPVICSAPISRRVPVGIEAKKYRRRQPSCRRRPNVDYGACLARRSPTPSRASCLTVFPVHRAGRCAVEILTNPTRPSTGAVAGGRRRRGGRADAGPAGRADDTEGSDPPPLGVRHRDRAAAGSTHVPGTSWPSTPSETCKRCISGILGAPGDN